MNNLIDFDINLFKLVNNINFKKNTNKNDIFEYYKKHTGICYSNLNILSKYRIKYKSFLVHSWYSKYVLPNCTKTEMYMDFIKRLQYMLITDTLIDNISNVDFIKTLDLKTNQIKTFEQSSYCILICYPDIILSHIFLKFYSSPLSDIFISKYKNVVEMNSTTITQIINDCSHTIDKLLFIRKNINLYEIDDNKPNLVIRCSELNQLLSSIDLIFDYFNNYNVFIDCWIVDTVISSNVHEFNNIYMNIVKHLCYFYNVNYQYILYVGNISNYSSAFIYDRYNKTCTKLIIFLDKCNEISLTHIPIINQADILLIKHHSELALLNEYNFVNKKNIYCIGNTTNNILLNLTKSESKHYNNYDIITFYCDGIVINNKIVEMIEQCCNKIGNNIKFLINSNIVDVDQHPHISKVDTETLLTLWNNLHVFVSLTYCTSNHIYNAIKQKQLIILPEKNCFINKNNKFGSFIKYKISKFNIDIVDQLYDFEPELESFSNCIKVAYNLYNAANLTESLNVNKIVNNNYKLIEKHKVVKF